MSTHDTHAAPGPISVSPDGHYFESPGGSPFFYLADTVWMLFNKLREEEARELFADRAAKGFTVIQAVVFRDLFEPNTPNAYGVRPFATDEDMRAVRINPDWLDYVVRITAIAGEYGLVMGILPTWGDKWNEHSNSAGPVIMDRDSAREYCRKLSDALADQANVIWILGGDSPVQKQEYADTIRAMADGIRAGGSGGRLTAFHPSGMGTSAIFHAEPWLAFNALQTSHYKPNIPGYLYIERLFAEQPAKPCLDMEPNYELSPMFVVRGGPEGQPYTAVFSDYDVRKSYYRTVLHGAAGFTYGCDPIRQLVREGDRIHVWADVGLPSWRESLSAPGSGQLALLRRVLEERSYTTRVPAQELLLPHRQTPAWPDRMAIGLDFAGQQNTDPASHVAVARCSEGRWIMAYLPVRRLADLDTSCLAGSRIRARVYDPQAGRLDHEYETPNTGLFRFVPEHNLDSLLVLDATET